MSGAETARRPVVQRRIGGAEMALPWNHTAVMYEGVSEGPLKGPDEGPLIGPSWWWEMPVSRTILTNNDENNQKNNHNTKITFIF